MLYACVPRKSQCKQRAPSVFDMQTMPQRAVFTRLGTGSGTVHTHTHTSMKNDHYAVGKTLNHTVQLNVTHGRLPCLLVTSRVTVSVSPKNTGARNWML